MRADGASGDRRPHAKNEPVQAAAKVDLSVLHQAEHQARINKGDTHKQSYGQDVSYHDQAGLLNGVKKMSIEDTQSVITGLAELSASTRSSHKKVASSEVYGDAGRVTGPIRRNLRSDAALVRISAQRYSVDTFRVPLEVEKFWTSRRISCATCSLPPDVPAFWFNKDPSWTDEYGNTALHVAASLGACSKCLLNIIHKGGVDALRLNTLRQTFLHLVRYKCCIDDDELAHVLIGLEFDFHHHDVYGRQPDISLPLLRFVDPFNLNVQNSKPQLIIKLCQAKDSDADPDCFRALIRRGADVNPRDLNLRTPLHLSINFGQTEITRLLLKHNANVHARDIFGQGLLAASEAALRAAKSNVALYARITACRNLAIDAGAVAEPSAKDEWRLPDYQYWPGDPSVPLWGL